MRARRIIRTGLAIAASWATLSVAAAGAAGETTITVEPTPANNAFSPETVQSTLSEAQFRWIWGAGGAGSVNPHDVQDTSTFGKLFLSGPPKNSGQFRIAASAGRFPYYCSVHPVEMRASLAVRPEAAAGYPNPFRVSWGSAETQTGSRFDVRYKVEGASAAAGTRRKRRSAWRMWREDTKSFSGVFGRRGEPVKVRSGSTYRFQARSKAGRKAKSGWSPPLVVGP